MQLYDVQLKLNVKAGVNKPGSMFFYDRNKDYFLSTER